MYAVISSDSIANHRGREESEDIESDLVSMTSLDSSDEEMHPDDEPLADSQEALLQQPPIRWRYNFCRLNWGFKVVQMILSSLKISFLKLSLKLKLSFGMTVFTTGCTLSVTMMLDLRLLEFYSDSSIFSHITRYNLFYFVNSIYKI